MKSAFSRRTSTIDPKSIYSHNRVNSNFMPARRDNVTRISASSCISFLIEPYVPHPQRYTGVHSSLRQVGRAGDAVCRVLVLVLPAWRDCDQLDDRPVDLAEQLSI